MRRNIWIAGSSCLCLVIVFVWSNTQHFGARVAPSRTPRAGAAAQAVADLLLQPTARFAAGPTRPLLVVDDVVAQGHRELPTAKPQRSGRSKREELLLLGEPHDGHRIDRPAPLSPEAALAALRALHEDRTATTAVVATTPPAPAGTATPTSLVATETPLPEQLSSPELPFLQVGQGLAGMPEYIVVGRTYAFPCVAFSGSIPTQRMLFVDYLRNVLANEWVASWPPAALDAGAIAVKQFAWYTVVVQQKWRSQGYPFDVVDSTCDQYYRDGNADPRTDAAFQRTWGTVLLRQGALLNMYFRDTEATCGGLPDCMGQVESAVLASAGQSTLQILARYFSAPDTVVLVSGAELPAELPPVPLAPAVPIHPTEPPTPPPPELTATAELVPTTPTDEPPVLTSEPVTVTVMVEPPAATAEASTATAEAATPEEGASIPPPVPVEDPSTPPPVPVEDLSTPPPVPVEIPATPTLMPPTPEVLPSTPIPPTVPDPVAMPNLVGLGENQAREVLAALGMTQVVVDYQGEDRLGDLFNQLAPSTVVSHIPPASEPTTADSVVILGIRAP